jgi:hypothetical protein
MVPLPFWQKDWSLNALVKKKASDPGGKLGKNLLSFSSSLVRGFKVVGGRDVEETRR